MQPNEDFSHFTLIGIEAALLAGDLLRKGFGTAFSISSKSTIHDLVTEYDRKSEKMILDFIQNEVPTSQFLAEESGKGGKKDSDILWIIDPLDGTVNFAHQIPFFAISIALQKDGKMHSGIIYHPITQELFVAEINRGAFLNGHRINVTKIKTLEKAFLATGFPYNQVENPHQCIDRSTDLLRMGVPMRRLGAAALDFAYTAAGRFDGFFESSLSPWDCAAGALLVQEAGGKVSNWMGNPYNPHVDKTVLATNGEIHKELVSVLNPK